MTYTVNVEKALNAYFLAMVDARPIIDGFVAEYISLIDNMASPEESHALVTRYEKFRSTVVTNFDISSLNDEEMSEFNHCTSGTCKPHMGPVVQFMYNQFKQSMSEAERSLRDKSVRLPMLTHDLTFSLGKTPHSKKLQDLLRTVLVALVQVRPKQRETMKALVLELRKENPDISFFVPAMAEMTAPSCAVTEAVCRSLQEDLDELLVFNGLLQGAMNGTLDPDLVDSDIKTMLELNALFRKEVEIPLEEEFGKNAVINALEKQGLADTFYRQCNPQ